MRLALCLAAALCLSAAAAAGVEFSKAEIHGKAVTVCRVNVKQEELHLFLRDGAGQPLKSFEGVERLLAPSGRKLVFGTNAGMYHGNLAPVGLFVEAGKELAPLNLANADGNFFLKPNGVFAVTPNGACVVESSEYPRLPEKARLATQSGPLLVRNGVIHPAFKPDSTFQLIRNGVGVPSPDIAVFVETDVPVNLHELALLFRDVLKCPDALYFDGTVSSLHAPALHRREKHIDLGPILGVVEKR